MIVPKTGGVWTNIFGAPRSGCKSVTVSMNSMIRVKKNRANNTPTTFDSPNERLAAGLHFLNSCTIQPIRVNSINRTAKIRSPPTKGGDSFQAVLTNETGPGG